MLIVDAHDDTRSMLCDLLAHRGHECRTAGDRDGALSQLEAFRPDAILVEWYKRGRPDTELVLALRTRLAELVMNSRLLVVSTLPDRPREGGADAYLLKPVRLEQVEAYILPRS